MTRRVRSRQAGLTLIEVMIAVALFSLIGLAGFTLVQSVIGVEQRTDHRMDELADLQRTMHILTSDFEQAEPGTLIVDGNAVSFGRAPETSDGLVLAIGYDLKDKTLRRLIRERGGELRAQDLISDVDVIKWRFLLPAGGWVDALPANPDDGGKPVAIALDISLSPTRQGHSGLLRRIVALPRAPRS